MRGLNPAAAEARGTFHGVSPKHLPRYLQEFSYRFDRRARESELFFFILAPSGPWTNLSPTPD